MESLNKIKKLEAELNTVLAAYKPTECAKLDDEQVQELQALEKSLKTTVIAFG